MVFVGLIPVAVIVGIIVLALRAPGGSRSPLLPHLAFLLTVAFVGMVMAVAALGVVTHAVAELVGPSPISASDYAGPPPGAFAPPPGTITGSSVPIGTMIHGITTSTLGADRHDRRNHDITIAVTGAAFALSGAVGFVLAWRRARRLLREPSSQGQFGRLPLGYTYFVVGSAAIAVLILAPLSASSGFRAIAPGVVGASGHADGLRRLTLTFVLLVLSVVVGLTHLRMANDLRLQRPLGSGEDADGSTDQ